MVDRSRHPMAQFVLEAMSEQADESKAAQMQAYAKTEQAYFGIQSPQRKAILKQARACFKINTFAEYERVVWDLWTAPQREAMYAATDLAIHYKRFRTDEAMPLYERMLAGANHWDLLDTPAAHLIGDLVKTNRSHEAKLSAWTHSENMWLRRTSLLAHLRHGKDTNRALLAETILALSHEREFFIRKAIGWVLRQYARVEPEWVKAFVTRYEARLSGLSKREALKHFK